MSTPQADIGPPPSYLDAMGQQPPGTSGQAGASVPPYSSIPPPIAPIRLDDARSTSTVTRAECIAHLKLLSAIADLRDTISRADGLFSVHDWQVDATVVDREEDLLKPLAILREKRWEVYVSRAVDRFTAWVQNCVQVDVGLGLQGRPLTVKDIETRKYSKWPEWDQMIPWTVRTMPPLDILMVWHAYMLNPRDFLEDCMRAGKMSFWAGGLPWAVVNDCINNSFDFEPGKEARAHFEGLTGLSWDNLDDPPIKVVFCPRCHEENHVPWTDVEPYSIGSLDAPFAHCRTGYADKGFRAACACCEFAISHDSLRLAKFCADVQKLCRDDLPMPGTLLKMDGVPLQAAEKRSQPLFPNKLIKFGVPDEIRQECDASVNDFATLQGVRRALQNALKSSKAIRRAKGIFIRAEPQERFALRKMMSRYWTNSSPFALDLVGAVIRQGTFIQKMDGLDWIHSPAVEVTIARLITKYERFFRIITENPGHIAVPTLDVDLAWHTHQLSPRRYYAYSIRCTSTKFIDHDDKIPEGRLSDAFEWTSKQYQRITNGQIYSECTCWYCEAIRERHNHKSAFFPSSSTSLACKNAALLHDRPDISSDPTKNPHISAHNAVRITGKSPGTLRRLEELRVSALKSQYETARRRMEKRRNKGALWNSRTNFGVSSSASASNSSAHYDPNLKYGSDKGKIPYTAYGVPVAAGAVFLPYAADPAITNDIYPCGPVCIDKSRGGVGNCIAATCTVGVSSGACAVIGGCYNGDGSADVSAGGEGYSGAGGWGDGGFNGCGGGGDCGGGGGGCGGGGGGCGGGGGGGGGGN